MAGFDLASKCDQVNLRASGQPRHLLGSRQTHLGVRWRLRKHRGFLRIEVGHCIMKTGNPENVPKMPGFLEEDALFGRSLLQHFGKQIIIIIFSYVVGALLKPHPSLLVAAPCFQVQLLQTCPLTLAAALQFLRHSVPPTDPRHPSTCFVSGAGHPRFRF